MVAPKNVAHFKGGKVVILAFGKVWKFGVIRCWILGCELDALSALLYNTLEARLSRVKLVNPGDFASHAIRERPKSRSKDTPPNANSL